MNYNTLTEAIEQGGWDQQIDALSVYRAFEQVEDKRHKRGVRYSVALILTLVVVGKLAGMTTLWGIAEWVRRLNRVAQRSVAYCTQELSLCGDLQQCGAGGGW